MLVIGIACLIILYRIERSWLGLIWTSISENDRLASSSGINVKRHKQLLLVITAFFIGIAGALYAHYMGSISPSGSPGDPFSFSASLYLIIYMMVGGEAYFAGPIIGTYILILVPQFGRSLQQYMPLLLGGILLLVVFLFPEGFVGLGARLTNALKARRTRDELPVAVIEEKEPSG